jgi:hypothetical protein
MSDPAFNLLGKFDVALNRLVGASVPEELQFGGQFSPAEDLNLRVAAATAAVSRLWVEQNYWREPEFAARFRRLMDLLHPKLRADPLMSTVERQVFILDDITEPELERASREFVAL